MTHQFFVYILFQINFYLHFKFRNEYDNIWI